MTKKVICIINSSEITELINNAFKELNIETAFFTNALDGLKNINKFTPDLIILDSLITDIPSFLMIEIIKNEYKTPVLSIAAGDNEIDKIALKHSDLIMTYSNKFLSEIVDFSLKLINEKDKPETIKYEINEDKIFNILNNRQIYSVLYDKLIIGISGIDNYELILQNIGSVLFEYFSIESLVFANIERNVINFYSLLCDDYSHDLHEASFNDFNIKLLNELNIENKEKYTVKKTNFFNKISSPPDNKVLKSKYFFPVNKTFKGGICLTLNNENDEELSFLSNIIPFLFNVFILIMDYKNNLFTADRLKHLFSNFLPVKVIDDLLKKTDIKSLMIGEKREVVVLFSHIRNFGYIEHHNDPEDVVSFLNNHFTGLSNCIKKHGGEINKFIGDAVFAMFGVPESFVDNENRACLAAVEMQEYVRNAQNTGIKFGEDGYQIGIGLNAGKAIIGNIGSSDNFDYTAIGDTVNLAARLESLNKHYKTGILISEGIYLGCKYSDFKFREVDTVMVKGKDKPTTIYAIINNDDFSDELLSLYQKGIKMFKIGNFNLAKEYFLQCKTISPDDNIINIYNERCDGFIRRPPLNWSGAISLDFK